MCVLCVVPETFPDEEGREPIPANRFEKVRRDIEAKGYRLGVIAVHESLMPDGVPAKRTIALTFINDMTGSLDQQLDDIETALESR